MIVRVLIQIRGTFLQKTLSINAFQPSHLIRFCDLRGIFTPSPKNLQKKPSDFGMGYSRRCVT